MSASVKNAGSSIQHLQSYISYEISGVSYKLGLLLEVDNLREEVCDLFLLSGGVLRLPGQIFSQRGHLQVGITWERQQGVMQRQKLLKSSLRATLLNEG